MIAYDRCTHVCTNEFRWLTCHDLVGRSVLAHEGYRWNTARGQIPSDDDTGSDHGGPMDHRIHMQDPRHRLLRRVNKRLRELRDEIDAYSRKRKNIRSVHHGNDLGDLGDVPAVALVPGNHYFIDEVVDAYYPDTDESEWEGHEDPTLPSPASSSNSSSTSSADPLSSP